MELILQKLRSRKLWVTIATGITSILAANHIAASNIERIIYICSGILVAIVYIIAEAFIDSKRTNTQEAINTIIMSKIMEAMNFGEDIDDLMTP
jgi:predicted nucleic-acid-binding protein